jgi:hypothetical protein
MSVESWQERAGDLVKMQHLERKWHAEWWRTPMEYSRFRACDRRRFR